LDKAAAKGDEKAADMLRRVTSGKVAPPVIRDVYENVTDGDGNGR
jgi:hypothetical protein